MATNLPYTMYVLSIMVADNGVYNAEKNEVDLTGSILTWAITRAAYEQLLEQLGPPRQEQLFGPAHVDMARKISDDMPRLNPTITADDNTCDNTKDLHD